MLSWLVGCAKLRIGVGSDFLCSRLWGKVLKDEFWEIQTIFGDRNRWLIKLRSDLAIGDTDEPAILVESYTASGNVTKGYPVELTNDGKVTVTPSTWYGFGVAKTDALDGEKCSVVRVGRVKVVANGALTALSHSETLEAEKSQNPNNS